MIFTFLFVSVGLVIFVQFKYIELIISNQSSFYKFLNRLNKCSVLIGMLSILGALIVANFQVTNATEMHLVGANLCFGCSLFYFFFQVSNAFKNILYEFLSLTH